jgi:hypothetical protein
MTNAAIMVHYRQHIVKTILESAGKNETKVGADAPFGVFLPKL